MSEHNRYSLDDLEIGTAGSIRKGDGVVIHTHTVHFSRPLTLAERALFADVLTGFYHTVYFSRRFGSGLIRMPVVEFPADDTAQYTLHQRELSGTWKELLMAILANFSAEVVPIRLHDESRAFDPALSPVTTA